jgi:hypothetical protein
MLRFPRIPPPCIRRTAMNQTRMTETREYTVQGTDEQIGEVVGLVSLQLLTGAFNLVAGIHAPTTARSAA